MKITKLQLRQIIKEELSKVLSEEDVSSDLRDAEKAGASKPIKTRSSDPEGDLADVAGAKDKLSKLVTMSEDASYSKIKNLLYKPFEEFVGNKAKQEVVGMVLRNLGVASALPIGAAIVAAAQGPMPFGLAAPTLAAVVMAGLAAAGSDLERRARIEQGKTVTTARDGESEGGRTRYPLDSPQAQATIKKMRAR